MLPYLLFWMNHNSVMYFLLVKKYMTEWISLVADFLYTMKDKNLFLEELMQATSTGMTFLVRCLWPSRTKDSGVSCLLCLCLVLLSLLLACLSGFIMVVAYVPVLICSSVCSCSHFLSPSDLLVCVLTAVYKWYVVHEVYKGGKYVHLTVEGFFYPVSWCIQHKGVVDIVYFHLMFLTS